MFQNRIFTIVVEDGGPVDEDHIDVIADAKMLNFGLEEINRRLARCKSPARAFLGPPATA